MLDVDTGDGGQDAATGVGGELGHLTEVSRRADDQDSVMGRQRRKLLLARDFTSFDMGRDIDYSSVEVPEDETPENYHYTARRAEILELIQEAGHPARLNQADLADRYDCTRQNIHNDINVLAEYVDDHLGERRALSTDAVFQRCICGLLEEEEWRDAARTVKEREDWLTEYQTLEELADEIEELKDQSGSDYKLK